MSQGLYSHTTRAIGTLLTAAIYNADHQNHITNLNPTQSGGYSDNVAQMQAMSSPGDVGSENLALNLAGEIERLRYAIAQITGLDQWYEVPQTTLADLSEGVFENPLVVETTDGPITARDPTNNTTERTLLTFELGSGAGDVAEFKGKGTGTNGVDEVALYIGGVEAARWPEAASATQVVPPQGYLSAHSTLKIPTADVSAATSIYYHCDVGNNVPIISSGVLSYTTFTEAMALALHSNHLASTLYDVFMWNDAGTLRIITGPAWTTSTAGAGARGTGAGTSELELVNGLYMNKVAMTGRNGATTYTVAANQAIYLGTIFIDSSAGQVTCHRAYGQSRKWGVWNCFNRRPIILKAGDSTASWTYNTDTLRASNNAAANSLTVFQGLPEELYDLILQQDIDVTDGGPDTARAMNGIGFNSTSAASGILGRGGAATNNSGEILRTNLVARFAQVPSIGTHVVTSLEAAVATGTATWYGTEASMLLRAMWRG